LTELRELVHGTCVALGTSAALLRGKPGSGKSDLALRFIALPAEAALRPRLVADDQVLIEPTADGRLRASPPASIAGKIEVRGLGIVPVPHLAEAELALVCDLVAPEEVPRMPPEPPERAVIAGVAVPILRLAPFEASAPLKLKTALFLASTANPK
jgi:serine kinase of HPr protein (carbohydrate metabolism regulator)